MAWVGGSAAYAPPPFNVYNLDLWLCIFRWEMNGNHGFLQWFHDGVRFPQTAFLGLVLLCWAEACPSQLTDT